LEPIPLNFPWQPREHIFDLPEAQLIQAIMVSAWRDATKHFSCPIREEARCWFFSAQFEEYCDSIDINPNLIQEKIKPYWSV
jgi:hypothetical protein